MTELDKITGIIKSSSFDAMSENEKNDLKRRQQCLIRELIKSTLADHLEPILSLYDFHSDICVSNENGLKVDFVNKWIETNGPHSATEPILNTDNNGCKSSGDFKGKPFMTHKLDWSPFLYGFTIDSEFHESVCKVLEKELPLKETIYAKLIIDDKTFDIKFDNPKIKNREDRIIRMLYKGKKETAGNYLQEIFPQAYEYIKLEKLIYGGRHQVTLPEHLQAMLTFYTTEEPLVFRMKY